MKALCSLFVGAIIGFIPHIVAGNQADDTTITIGAKTPGVTPFINQLTLVASDTTVLSSVQFTIAPKPGSVTRPLSGTYSSDYLSSRGYLLPATGQIFLPVYGLYAGYTNSVTLTYHFLDGSSKDATTTVTTPVYDDVCQFGSPTVLQARTTSTALSYDYIMVKGHCTDSSPTIIDSDSAVRWIGAAAISDITSTFFDNAVYQAAGAGLYRIDLDGTVTFLRDYYDIGVTFFHHNIDRGKFGLILDANTSAYVEATNIEVDAAGNVLKIWSLPDIISAAMIAGGDDPSQFVYPSPVGWFHNNAVTYNRADDSIIISSRENFVICLDYDSGAIKWILGDPTKKWHEFPSLSQYALDLAPGTNPPIGQHAVSLSYDQDLLLFDNGYASWIEIPKGDHRSYSSPRKYQLDTEANLATEVWNFDMGQDVFSSICSSVYEDAPQNYLVDYSYIYKSADTIDAQLLGVDSTGGTVFYYQYPSVAATCEEAFNAIPLHLENTKFPTVGPQVLNLSTRGLISSGDNVLIGGFIITGSESKSVVLRALGPSLADSGVTGTLDDPVITLYDSSGNTVTANDNWQSDPGAAEITAKGLAPTNAAESATLQTLAPGAYTAVVNGNQFGSGIALVEIYDLSPSQTSRLANLSTRGQVGTGDNALIAGFVAGDVANTSLVIRALGPSLASSHIGQPLEDPNLTVYDQNGAAIASNDDWLDDVNHADIQNKGLAPADPSESALVLFPPAGAYSAIAQGADGDSGVGLVEVYDID